LRRCEKPVVKENRQLFGARNIVIGAGCRKGCEPSALQGFIEEELNLLGIDRRAVGAVASIDIKTDEPAIRLAAELL
jgi:cobalamin biosynthesis protein CbiG